MIYWRSSPKGGRADIKTARDRMLKHYVVVKSLRRKHLENKSLAQISRPKK